MENTRRYKGQQSKGQKTRERKKKTKTVYISNKQKRLLQNKKITKKTRLPCTKNQANPKCKIQRKIQCKNQAKSYAKSSRRTIAAASFRKDVNDPRVELGSLLARKGDFHREILGQHRNQVAISVLVQQRHVLEFCRLKVR